MREARLPDLYLAALALDPARRGELLDRLRATEPLLAEELARLLAAPDGAPSPIDGSALADAGVDRALSPVPERVGPYRIVRELGRGGMGRVFLAEQETPDFRRTVALKLIDRPGPDEEAVARFRAEVRILASLDHPGIVRFLDGGRSPEGIWFLALEHVDGEDLVTHAADHGLDVPQRLWLFLAVTEAVDYAHARGVVHRDLKPTNVLVGRDGRPRLLDFGISKLLAPPGAEHPALTRTDFRPLTPAYASPEQLAGEPATAVSDVYSLGIMLYELLAGRRPDAWDGPADSSQPSHEHRAGGSHPEGPSAARRRGAKTSRRPSGRTGWRRRRAAERIGRNLDAICLKALARNPADRYQTAAALCEDLRRHLEGRRVLARGRAPGEGGEGRRRWRAWAVAALGALLLAGAIGWFARPRPGSELAGAAPAASASGLPFDLVLPPPVEEMERRFADQPDDVIVGSALALGLLRDRKESEASIVIGRLREIPGKELDPFVDYAEGRLATRLGENQRALVLYTRARDNALALGNHELLGSIRWARGATLSRLGQRDAAREELELGRADFERAGDPKNLYRILNDLAIEYLQRGDMARGEATLESALAAARRGGFEASVALSNLAEVKLLRGRPDLAEPLAREALELLRGLSSRAREVDGLTRLAQIASDLGHPEEAEALVEEALALAPSVGREMLTGAIHLRALLDLEAARLDRLDALAKELEAAGEGALRFRPLGLAHGVRARAAALQADLADARRHFAEARRLLLAEGDRDLAALSDLAWAEVEAGAGEDEAALRILDEALGALTEATATLAGDLAAALRARLEAAAGRPKAARGHLAMLGEDGARAPSVTLRLATLRARAWLQAAEGRHEAARADCREAIADARRAGRKRDELELRIDLAALEGDPATSARLAAEVEGEAQALGLAGLVERARAVARGADRPAGG